MQRTTQWTLSVSRPSSWVAMVMALWMAFLSTASIGARYGDTGAGLAGSSQGALCTLGLAGEGGDASPQTLFCPLCASASAPLPANRQALQIQPASSAAPCSARVPAASVSPVELPPPARGPPHSPVLS